MRRAAVLLVYVGATLAVWGLTPERGAAEPAAAVAPAASPSVNFAPWVPSESWPGGRQYDARLERTVRFWGAGMALRDVFAGVREQTGVAIGFWPAGDVNERICVTLYLNPEQPPTLREIIAQLSWVTDCGFGYDAEEGAARYSLLSTSVGQGAMEKLREERAATAAAREEDRLSAYRDRVARVLAAVDECRGAVGLSQEELVRRYRGKDDVLLLALLDPEYRAGVEFAASLPRAELGSIPDNMNPVRHTHWALGWKWCELTREQRNAIGAAVGMREEEACWGDEELTNAEGGAVHGLRVGLGVSEDVILYQEGLGVAIEWREGSEPQRHHSKRVEIPLLRWPGRPASAETDLKIRQLLGENIAHEEMVQAEEAYWRLMAEQNRATALRTAQHAMTEHRALSEAAEERLAALEAAVPLQTAYSLWQVQEAAAAASGMHVVSDCFWQPEQSIESMLARSPRGDAPRLSLLDVLTLRCGSTGGVDPLRPAADRGEWTASQEWGDAGEVLRFRSLRRAVWREAFLPEHMLSAADFHLGAVLAESGEPAEARREVKAPVSVRELAGIAAATSEPQQHVGGMLTYGDPADAMNAYRRPYLSRLLREVRQEQSVLGAVAELSDEEWESLEGAGLHDVTIGLKQRGQRVYVRLDVVRLVPSSMCPTPEMADWWAEKRALEESWGLEPGSWETAEETVLYLAGEGRRWVETFPSVLRVKPTSTERLVEVSDTAGTE